VLNEELAALETRKTKLDNDIKSKTAASDGAASASSAMDTSEGVGNSVGELTTILTDVKANIDQVKHNIINEQSKIKSWKEENVRRRHNYVPFIFNLMKLLAENGKLADLVEKGAKVTAEKNARAKASKEKEKEKDSTSATQPSSSSIAPMK